MNQGAGHIIQKGSSYIYIHIHFVYLYTHISMYIYICVYTYMYIRVFVYTYMYICICMYIYTHIHRTCIQTWVHIYMFTSLLCLCPFRTLLLGLCCDPRRRGQTGLTAPWASEKIRRPQQVKSAKPKACWGKACNPSSR